MTTDRPRPSWWPGLTTAREIAAVAGSRGVGTEHVLLALLRRGEDGTADVLRLDETSVDAAIRGVTGTGRRAEAVPVERVTISPRVLALVREAARRHPASSGPVSDLHVLGALLDGDDPSLARLVLTALGVLGRARRTHRERAEGLVRP